MAEFKCSDFVFRVCSLYAPNRNPDRDDYLIECADLVDPSVSLFYVEILTLSLTALRIVVPLALGIIRVKAFLH